MSADAMPLTGTVQTEQLDMFRCLSMISTQLCVMDELFLMGGRDLAKSRGTSSVPSLFMALPFTFQQ